MSRDYEWVSKHMKSLVDYVDNAGPALTRHHKNEFTSLAQVVDGAGHDEPVEELIHILETDIDYIKWILDAAQSSRVDEILDTPDPCAGHKENDCD